MQFPTRYRQQLNFDWLCFLLSIFRSLKSLRNWINLLNVLKLNNIFMHFARRFSSHNNFIQSPIMYWQKCIFFLLMFFSSALSTISSNVFAIIRRSVWVYSCYPIRFGASVSPSIASLVMQFSIVSQHFNQLRSRATLFTTLRNGGDEDLHLYSLSELSRKEKKSFFIWMNVCRLVAHVNTKTLIKDGTESSWRHPHHHRRQHHALASSSSWIPARLSVNEWLRALTREQNLSTQQQKFLKAWVVGDYLRIMEALTSMGKLWQACQSPRNHQSLWSEAIVMTVLIRLMKSRPMCHHRNVCLCCDSRHNHEP